LLSGFDLILFHEVRINRMNQGSNHPKKGDRNMIIGIG